MAKKKKKFQCSIDSNDIHILSSTSVQDLINDYCGGVIEMRDLKKSEELINVNKDINQNKSKILMEQKHNNTSVIPSSWLAEELRNHAIKAFPRKNMNIDINFAKKLNINRSTLSTYKNGSRKIINLQTLINIKKTVLGEKKFETGISKWINKKEINKILLDYLGLTGELELISCLRLEKKIKDLYTTRDLIYDLLYETELFENELSLKLGQGKQFLAHIKQKLTNIKDQSYDPHYKFSKELLDSFKVNIRKNLKKKTDELIEYINNYEALNPDLKLYRKQQHNVENSDFFFIIDTLEKAYWFGFLCADGSILYIPPKLGERVRYRVYIQLSYKDKAQLVKFCNTIGYDSTKIIERYSSLLYKNKIKQFKSVALQFVCKEMVENLLDNDFASSNADYKTLPSFLKKEKYLFLAFLLGYFDGDGTKNKPRGGGLIYCSNKPFLEEIR
ncbi:MAG: LAGLIDADG family homing endonuclease, partial [Candidatus Hodarchaeota archaeon]